MKTISFNVYKASELNNAARDRAYREWKDSFDYWDFCGNDAIDMLYTIAKEMGLVIEDIRCNLARDHSVVWRTPGYSPDLGLDGSRAYAWIENHLFWNPRRKAYRKGKAFRYSRLGNPDWLDDDPFTNTGYDFAVQVAWDRWMDSLRHDISLTVEDFLFAIGDFLFGEYIPSEYEEMTSIEAFEEFCEGNDIYFYADGKRYL